MTKEEHILQCLQEEASEVIKAASKINRFGLRAFNPLTGECNEDILWKECHDLLAVMQMINDMFNLGLGEGDKAETAIKEKKRKVLEYIEQYAKPRGVID